MKMPFIQIVPKDTRELSGWMNKRMEQKHE